MMQNSMIRRFLAIATVAATIASCPGARAGDIATAPPPPAAGAHDARQPESVPALASVLAQGIRPRFWKHDDALNLDVWWMMRETGTPVPVYTSPDGRFLFIAMIYDSTNGGNPILNDQVEQITAIMKADGTLPTAAGQPALPAPAIPPAMPTEPPAVAAPAAYVPPATTGAARASTAAPSLSKAAQVLDILAQAPYVEIGKAPAPIVYAVVDPQCPYCEGMFRAIAPAIAAGTVRVRLIIVAALDGSQPISLGILGSPDIGVAWSDYVQSHGRPAGTSPDAKKVLLRNEQTRLALDAVIGGQGVPLIIYTNRQGKLGYLRGIPSDALPSLVADIGPFKLP